LWQNHSFLARALRSFSGVMSKQITAHQPIVIPVIAEELEVGTREVERLGVRLTKTVSERIETVDVPLMEERTEVERVTINKAVDTPPPVRYEGDTMIVPVLEEILVTEKRLILREELHIRKWQVEARKPQTVTLRREHVRIDEPSPERQAGTETIREGATHDDIDTRGNV
jgi:uncharacterized protein (TIGR02271 family)